MSGTLIIQTRLLSLLLMHHIIEKQLLKSKRTDKKTTFERTLGHPVDLSPCRGSQQAAESRKQQRYEQQQHGVRTSDPPLRDDDN